MAVDDTSPVDGVDPLVVVISGHRRPYRFHRVADLFGAGFAERLAETWRYHKAPENTARNHLDLLMAPTGWFRWMRARADQGQRESAPVQAVVRHFEAGAAGIVATDALAETCRQYAEFLGGQPAVPQRRRVLLLAARNLIKRFGADLGLPGLDRGVRLPATFQRDKGSGFPSLAEITRRGVVDWSNPDDAIREVLQDAGFDGAELTFESKLAAVARLNNARLSALRRVLELDLKRAYSRFKEGERVLALPGLPPTAEVVAVLEGGSRKGEIVNWLRDVAKGDPERKMNLLLRWLLARGERGVVPDLSHTTGFRRLMCYNSSLPQHFGLSIAEAGRRRIGVKVALQEFVSIVPRSWTAALGLLLIDTGWNVQQLLDLPADPFVGGTTKGKRAIVTTKVLTQYKARAGHDVDAVLAAAREGAVLLDLHPGGGEALSGIDVIGIVQAMTGRFRLEPSSGPLFLCAVNHSPVPMLPDRTTQAEWWSRALARHADDPVIGGLPINRAMVRKTKLDIAAMDAGADHAPAQLLAGHASAATTMQRYLRTPWFRRELDNHIRRFQGLFEAAVSRDIADVSAYLGISEDALAERQAVALETGLGFACLRPFDGVQPSVPPGQRCDALDRCHLGCPARRFVPTQRGLVSLVLTNRSLREAEAVWIAQNPGRWIEVWMPLLAETEAYLDRLRDSSFRTRLAAASDEVEADLAEGALSLVDLW